MTARALELEPELSIKTGRRVNPAIDGPRDNTVCFMLSEKEKFAVDRLAFCMNITRSGLLAKIVAGFVEAAESKHRGKKPGERLADYLDACRAAVKRRGEFATQTLREMKGDEK